MKIFKIFSMAALALTLAACSNDDNETANPAEAGVMHFKATIAAPNSGATTRTEYTENGTSIDVKWKEGDEIKLSYGYEVSPSSPTIVTATVTAVDEATGAATIEADFPQIEGLTDGAMVFMRYPLIDNFETDLEQQDGTLEYIQDKLDWRSGRGNLSVSGSDVSLKENVKLENGIFIWKLTLTDGTSPIEATKVTIKAKIEDYEFSIASTKDAIDGKSTVYLAASGSGAPYTITIEATDGSDTYTYSKDDVTLENGNYYQSTVTLTKVAAEGHSLEASAVGEIVGTDGLAYAVADKDKLPSGVTAVAVVAYKGSDTNHDTYKNGLAIAMADESSSNWSTAKSTCEGKAAVANAAWMLPSMDQWKAMFKANGGDEGKYSGLNTTIDNAGGTALQQNGYYWSSTEDGSDGACGVFLYGGSAVWFSGSKGDDRRVRACLAF